MYTVISEFHDLTDWGSGRGFWHYKAGDTYPREGLEPSKERVLGLLTGSNAQHKKLIEPSRRGTESETAAAGASPAGTAKDGGKPPGAEKRPKKRGAR